MSNLFKSVYFRVVVGLILLAYGIHAQFVEVTSLLSLAALFPIRLMDPDPNGTGGGGGGGTDPDRVTISKAEYEQLKAQPEQMFGNGVKEGMKRISDQLTGYLAKRGFTISGDSVDKILEPIITSLEQKAQAPNEQAQLFESKYKTVEADLSKERDLRTKAEQDRDNYIISNELQGAAGSRVHDPQAAVALFMQQSGYSVRRTEEGVRIYKGAQLHFVNGQIATPKDVMDEFLTRTPWLVKVDSRQQQQGGQERSGLPENFDPSKVTPKQADEMLDKLKSGELNLR